LHQGFSELSSSQKTQTQQQSANTIDPQQMAMYQANYKTAQGNAANLAQPYTGQLTAGFTPAQVQAQGILSGVATDPAYQQTANAATAGATGILNSNPLSAADLQQYMNPYTSNVIDTTNQQIGQQRQIAQNQANQQATAAGAFGGSRSGVANALTNQYYDQDTAATDAQLNQANFTQAQNASLAAKNLGLNAAATTANLNNNALGVATNQGGILSAVGDAQQQQQQTELSNAYQAWLMGKNLTLEQQNLLNSALGMIPVQQTVNSNGTSTTTSNGGLGGILGGLGSLAKGAAGLVPLLAV
jgi:hypothetical protein